MGPAESRLGDLHGPGDAVDPVDRARVENHGHLVVVQNTTRGFLPPASEEVRLTTELLQQ